MLGSPLYMAPEQMMRPKDVDPRADVWSLGMTLFHGLAGQAALAKCRNFTELVMAISRQPIPALQELAPWVDPGLARVVHGALIREVEARCPSLDLFLDALAPYAEGKATIAPGDMVALSEERRAHRPGRTSIPSHWDAEVTSSSAPTVPQESSLLGRTVGGRFRLEEVLHESPTATLYAASEGAERCALKLFRPEISSRREWMVNLDGRLTRLQAIKNEHIARLLGHGFDEETQLYFVATELLRGQDLGALIRSRGNLAPGAVARALVQIGQGLSAAHGAGVVHENLKPSNVFLHELEDGRVVARLCDFGQPAPLEHSEGEDGPALSLAGRFALSPMYLSPEQVQGKPATMRSDLWSMALVLYEALSGRKPWQGYHSLGELLLAIQHEEIRPIREVAPWVEGGLAEAIHGGLRRDPSQRYSSIRDMIVALGPFAGSARALQLHSFSTSRPNVVIHSDRNVSALDKTAVADSSSTQPRVQLPSVPPAQEPHRPQGPADTLLSVAPGAGAPKGSTAIVVAVVAALAVVAVVALLLR